MTSAAKKPQAMLPHGRRLGARRGLKLAVTPLDMRPAWQVMDARARRPMQQLALDADRKAFRDWEPAQMLTR